MKLIPAFIRGKLSDNIEVIIVTFKTYDNGGDRQISFRGDSKKWRDFKRFLGVKHLDDHFDGKGVILIVSDKGTILAVSNPLETKVFSL